MDSSTTQRREENESLENKVVQAVVRYIGEAVEASRVDSDRRPADESDGDVITLRIVDATDRRLREEAAARDESDREESTESSGGLGSKLLLLLVTSIAAAYLYRRRSSGGNPLEEIGVDTSEVASKVDTASGSSVDTEPESDAGTAGGTVGSTGDVDTEPASDEGVNTSGSQSEADTASSSDVDAE